MSGKLWHVLERPIYTSAVKTHHHSKGNQYLTGGLSEEPLKEAANFTRKITHNAVGDKHCEAMHFK